MIMFKVLTKSADVVSVYRRGFFKYKWLFDCATADQAMYYIEDKYKGIGKIIHYEYE